MANKLRLLRLSPEVLTLLREHNMTERHARALLRLGEDALQLQAAQAVVAGQFTVSQTEAHVEQMLHPAELPEQDKPSRSAPPKKPVFMIRDIRFFLNTITRGLTMMNSAGVNAACERKETDDTILLTIRIPKEAS